MFLAGALWIVSRKNRNNSLLAVVKNKEVGTVGEGHTQPCVWLDCTLDKVRKDCGLV